MKGKRFHIVTALLAALVLAVAALAAVAVFANSPAADGGEPTLFTVKSGSSASSVVRSLAESGLVRSDRFGYVLVRALRYEPKAGSYMLSPSMTAFEILRKLDEGKQECRKVTVPEGLTLSRVARRLEDSGAVRAEDFVRAAKDPSLLSELDIRGRTAEGYLFPDTYFIPYGADAPTIVRLMVRTFFEKTAAIPNLPADRDELQRKVILASIVEREYRAAEEAPKIASVFVNRMRIGMGLQSCATVVYIITEIQGKPHPSRLTNQDVEIASDYNTYKWAGLPPGPIASPGLTALNAACNPADTSYLYFRLTDPEAGTHSFTHSLAEHVRAGRTLDVKRAAED